ncbi:hypothetical protein SAMN05519103_03205 [Rhizobiales bacterium GAS113]|nr:hypothetical protein SAMN05519103_03205 [Rhizobiales bacterium GAS113]
MAGTLDTLSDSELPALRFYLTFCSQLGAGAEPFNPGQWRGYCGWVSSLDAAYSDIGNTTFQAFIDKYFTLLVDVPSAAVPAVQLSFKHLYVVYAYSVGCKIGDNFEQGGGFNGVWSTSAVFSYFHVHSGTWKDMWSLFADGYQTPFGYRLGPWAGMTSARYLPWPYQFAVSPSDSPITTWNNGNTNDVQQGWAQEWQEEDWGDDDKQVVYDHAKSAVRRPTSPILKKATDDVLQAWGANPPPEVIHRASGTVVPDPRQGYPIPDLAYTDGFDAVGSAEGVLAKWTDFPNVQTATAAAWTLLVKATKTLLADTSALTGDQYFFLFHLLIALASGDTESERLAYNIMKTDAPSGEYPKEILINQLIYLILMNLGDPLGKAEPHAQLQQFVSDYAGVLGSSNAGKLVAASLDHYRKLLQADSAYPLQDSFAAKYVGFSQRQSDTGDALDAARPKVPIPA